MRYLLSIIFFAYILLVFQACNSEEGVVQLPKKSFDKGDKLPTMSVMNKSEELFKTNRLLDKPITIITLAHLKHPSAKAQIILLDRMRKNIHPNIDIVVLIINNRDGNVLYEYEINRPFSIRLYTVNTDEIGWLDDDFVLPILFFVKSDATIVRRHDGYVAEEQLLKILESCSDEPNR